VPARRPPGGVALRFHPWIDLSGAMSTLARLSYELKTVVARYPALALPIQRARKRGEVIREDTRS